MPMCLCMCLYSCLFAKAVDKGARQQEKEERARPTPAGMDPSGHKGIMQYGNKWRARIHNRLTGKLQHIGLFNNIQSAVRAYEDRAQEVLHGHTYPSRYAAKPVLTCLCRNVVAMCLMIGSSVPKRRRSMATRIPTQIQKATQSQIQRMALTRAMTDPALPA